MRKLLLTLLFVPWPGYSQELSTYTGNYPTELSAAGEATYTYYLENFGKKVRHGDFKYTLRQENNISKISCDVKGKYINGLKNGTWTYKITLRDYPEQKLKNEYATGTILFTAGYNNGIPHGKWSYTFTKKVRKLKSSANNRTDWDKYGPAITERAIMVFNNGLAVDSVQVQKNDYVVYGQCNYEGFLTGQWLISSGNKQIIEDYQQGFLLRKEIRDAMTYILIDTVNNYADYTSKILFSDSLVMSNPSRLRDLNYRIDTGCLFSQREHLLTKTFHDLIFDNPFLLFRNIEGDQSEPDKLKGLFVRSLKYQLTAAEQEKLNSVHQLALQINRLNNELIKYTKDEQMIAEVETIIKRIAYFKKLGDKYVCLSDNYCSAATMNEGLAIAQKKCTHTIHTIEPLPVFKNKNEAMDYFIHDLTLKKKQAEENFILIKTKLMPQQ